MAEKEKTKNICAKYGIIMALMMPIIGIGTPLLLKKIADKTNPYFEGIINKNKIVYFDNLLGERMEVYSDKLNYIIEESNIADIYHEKNKKTDKTFTYINILGIESNSFKKSHLDKIKFFYQDIKKKINKQKI